MASEEPQGAGRTEETTMTTADTGAPAEALAVGKKRPRLDLTVESNRERKRGKSMFGILLGTLNKAKKEDEDRNTSEAAKKRADIDRRLQAQIAEEHDTSRRMDEIKRDKQAANRKEEELKLRQSIYQARRTRLPALASFLRTSDEVPDDPESLTSSANPLGPPPRTHPPPLYYLPAVLLPSQDAFLKKRKAEVKEAAEKEWQDWLKQRQDGYDEIDKLRARVEEGERRAEEMKSKEDSKSAPPEESSRPENEDVKMEEVSDVAPANGNAEQKKGETTEKVQAAEKMPQKEGAAKDGDVSMAADGEEAVEY